MPTLHTLNKSTISDSATQDCLKSLAEGDTLLLIEKGVALAPLLSLKTKQVALCLLEKDQRARDIILPEDSVFKSISDTDFVELCCQNNNIVSWF